MRTLEGFLSELRQRDVTLWLEDDRLRYRAPEGSLAPEELMELRDRKAEIIEFLKAAKQLSSNHQPPLQPVPRGKNLPLSFAQQRFWFLYQFEPDSPANNLPVVVSFTGTLRLDVLKRSVEEVVRRHEVLRSRFPTVDGQPVLVIDPGFKVELPVIDLQNIPTEQRDAEAHQIITKDARQPFDLEKGSLLRVTLFRLTEQDHLLLWNMPCIICDGTSSDLFYQELTTCYVAYATGKSPDLPELPIQYADFAHWQRQYLQGEVLDSHLTYWQQLSGNLTSLQLPTDYPRSSGLPTCRGDRYARMLPKSLHQSLLSLSQELATTLFVVLLATFDVLLHRYSQQDDILTTFVSSGRNRVETENLIGFFSNTLILRTHFDQELTFRELVQRIHRQNLDAYAHQELPFERLVDALSPEQRQGQSPLFQTKFTLNPPWTNGQGMAPLVLPDLKIESLFGYIYHGKTKYDLILVTREQDQGLGAVIDYNAELFTERTVERMMGHFQTLLESVVANPDQQILDLPLLTAREQQQIVEWNQTRTNAALDLTIPQIFQAQVQKRSTAIALWSEHQSLTYQDLSNRANQFANYLRSIGVQPLDRIGIGLERSTETIIALLGVLKVGATYIPLDLQQNSERLSAVLEKANPKLIITQARFAERFLLSFTKIVCMDKEQETIQQASLAAISSPLTLDSAAYIWHDPDSTEELVISHQGVINLVQNDLEIAQDECLLQHTSLCQVASTFEIWGALLNGAQLAIAPNPTPQELGNLIERQKITVLWLPTRWFHRLVEHHLQQLRSLRQVFVGGDILSVPQVQAFLKVLPSCNLTQVHLCPVNTVFACRHRISNLGQIDSAIPVGRATANTELYLLNRQRQPVPIGVPGELYVGGAGLAQRTSTQSVANPFSPNTSLYQSGYLARYLSNGDIELIGQIEKIPTRRNWRIELGRVETLLSQHPMVQEVVVIAHPSLPSDESIVAYVVFRANQSASSAELRNYLRHKLPLLMIPSYFVTIAQIPLAPDGQVDAAHLPLPPSQETQVALSFSGNDVEQRLTQIWRSLFNSNTIDIQDNFFDLGGDSLLAVRLFSTLR